MRGGRGERQGREGRKGRWEERWEGKWGWAGREVGVGWAAAYTGQQLSALLFISQIIKDD